jgi:hypothetical protein
MPHLMLTSALLFALLAVVATAIGACLRIARDVMLNEADEGTEGDFSPSHAALNGNGLDEDFGLGLRHHAANFAPDSGQSFRRDRSLNA